MISIRKHWLGDVSIELFRAALQKDLLLVGTSDTIVGFLAAVTQKISRISFSLNRSIDSIFLLILKKAFGFVHFWLLVGQGH